jgi:hypothetical protein
MTGEINRLTHKSLKARDLAKTNVKAEYKKLGEEFTFLDRPQKSKVGSNEHDKWPIALPLFGVPFDFFTL